MKMLDAASREATRVLNEQNVEIFAFGVFERLAGGYRYGCRAASRRRPPGPRNQRKPIHVRWRRIQAADAGRRCGYPSGSGYCISAGRCISFRVDPLLLRVAFSMTRRTNSANKRFVAVSKRRSWSSVRVEMASLISRCAVFFMDHRLPCGVSRFKLNSNQLDPALHIGSPFVSEFLPETLGGEGVTLRILAILLPMCSNIQCALFCDIVLRCTTTQLLTRLLAQELRPKSRLARSRQGRVSSIPLSV